MRRGEIKWARSLWIGRTGHGEHILSAQLSGGILAGSRIAGQEKMASSLDNRLVLDYTVPKL
jgi:hypothetical protein